MDLGWIKKCVFSCMLYSIFLYNYKKSHTEQIDTCAIVVINQEIELMKSYTYNDEKTLKNRKLTRKCLE